jgi:hypothetical protein
MVAEAFAGGLAAGFCWAMRAVVAMRRPAQAMRSFMGDSPPQRLETAVRCNGTIVAPEGGGGEEAWSFLLL